MRRLRIWLTLTLFFTALAVMTVLAMNVVAGMVAFLYRNIAGTGLLMAAGRVTAGLAAIGLLVALGAIAFGAALTPGCWARKAIAVIPLLLLGLTFVGGVLLAFGNGLTGTLGVGPVGLPLSGLWTIVAGIGAVLSAAIAAATTDLDRAITRFAVRAISVTAVVAVPATVTIGVVAWMASTSQTAPGGVGTFAPPPAGQPQGAAPVPGVQSTPGGPREPLGETRPGFVEGGFRRGGVAGGFANVSRSLPAVGAAGLALSLGGLAFGVIGWRKMRTDETGSVMPAVREKGGLRGELVRAVAALCGMGALALVLFQFVPVSETNPPVQTSVAWDSSETKDLFYRACADCHSNETVWPWYAHVAPASWLTVIDVNSARRQFNISEPSGRGSFGGFGEVNDIRQRIESGSMPPKDYLLMHPSARLTEADKQQLIQGLQSSLR